MSALRKHNAAITDKQLHKICEEFREGMLEGRKSKGMCGIISWALQGYLTAIGVETRSVIGNIGKWNHVWLELPDGTVIDCTADQFNRGKIEYPKVYIGKRTGIHQEEKAA